MIINHTLAALPETYLCIRVADDILDILYNVWCNNIHFESYLKVCGINHGKIPAIQITGLTRG